MQQTTEQKPKRAKPKSRAARWADACGRASAAFEALAVALEKVAEATGDLRGVQEEYEEWRDNLPENLASSALGERLEEVCGLEIEGIEEAIRSVIEEQQAIIDEAEGIDLPRGFGRD